MTDSTLIKIFHYFKPYTVLTIAMQLNALVQAILVHKQSLWIIIKIWIYTIYTRYQLLFLNILFFYSWIWQTDEVIKYKS